MSQKERIYSVLIVSNSDKFNKAFESLLPHSKYDPVQTVASISAAKRAFSERSYDFIIINSPLPDETGTRFAIDICNSSSSVVLITVAADDYNDIFCRVVEHGVFAIAMPSSKITMMTALDWMAASREKLRKSEKKTLSIEEKMEEIRIINRAKWLLITELKMTEPDAHRYIEKQAMNQCISKLSVAEDIIKTYK